MIERLAEKLSPEGKEVLEQVHLGPGEKGTAKSLEIVERISSLPHTDQKILSRLLSLYAQQSSESVEEAQKEKEELQRVRDIAQRAIDLSGDENMKIGEAFEWLRKEGRLSAEEERFHESIKGREVEVPT